MSCNTSYEACPIKKCDLSNEFFGWYDSVAGLRLITASLSVLGAASIVWVSIISRRLRSSEIHPIFMISVADLFLSLLYIAGSSLWLLGKTYPPDDVFSSVNQSQSSNGACLYISFFTTWVHLASTNLTVLYAFFVCLGLRKTLMQAQGVIWASYRYTCIIIISYLLAWLVPGIASFLVFCITAVDTNLTHDAVRCGCWCKPSVINGLPVLWLQDKNDDSPYLDHLITYAIAMYSIMIINISVAFLLLVLNPSWLFQIYQLTIFYALVMRYLKKLKNYGGIMHREFEYLSPEKSYKAKLRMYTFLLIFVITGLVNFILLCDALNFLQRQDKYVGSHITDHKQREFTILLLLQSLTVSLQGFLNAMVYGWTRQDFVIELKIGNDFLEDFDSQRSRGANGYQSLPNDFQQSSQREDRETPQQN